jgi:hypothetical protein
LSRWGDGFQEREEGSAVAAALGDELAVGVHVSKCEAAARASGDEALAGRGERLPATQTSVGDSFSAGENGSESLTDRTVIEDGAGRIEPDAAADASV